MIKLYNFTSGRANDKQYTIYLYKTILFVSPTLLMGSSFGLEWVIILQSKYNYLILHVCSLSYLLKKIRVMFMNDKRRDVLFFYHS